MTDIVGKHPWQYCLPTGVDNTRLVGDKQNKTSERFYNGTNYACVLFFVMFCRELSCGGRLQSGHRYGVDSKELISSRMALVFQWRSSSGWNSTFSLGYCYFAAANILLLQANVQRSYERPLQLRLMGNIRHKASHCVVV